MPGARWAGISVIEGRQAAAVVPADPIVAKLDKLQSELGDGPCITALREHHTVHIDDMSTDTRWPQFCRQAVELGVHSLLSFQLFVHTKNLGALNLYAGEAGAVIASTTDDAIKSIERPKLIALLADEHVHGSPLGRAVGFTGCRFCSGTSARATPAYRYRWAGLLRSLDWRAPSDTVLGTIAIGL